MQIYRVTPLSTPPFSLGALAHWDYSKISHVLTAILVMLIQQVE